MPYYSKILRCKCWNLAVSSMKFLATTIRRGYGEDWWVSLLRVCTDAMPMLNTGDHWGLSSNRRPGTLPGMAAQAGSKRRLKGPIEEAAQAESVNCSSQRLARMPSPLMSMRLRTSGSANSGAADPMEGVDGDLQDPPGIWEHSDRANVTNEFAQHVSWMRWASLGVMQLDTTTNPVIF